MKIKALVFLASALVVGCRTSPPFSPVTVTARLERFQENAEWSHFTDGSYESNHASVFRIVAPSALCGKLLTVYQELPAAGSPLRSVGSVFNLSVLRARLDALLEDDTSREFYGTSWATVLGPATEQVPDCP